MVGVCVCVWCVCVQEVREQSSTVLPEQVRWVITVPAVWKQPAKQFMREAAYLVRTHTHTHMREAAYLWENTHTHT